MRHLFVLPALLLAPTLACAQAGEVWAGDPESVRAAIQAGGHKARIETLETGEPTVVARTDGGINYAVYFYGCESEQGCLDLQFMAAFDIEPRPTAQQLNDYNAEWVIGKAFLDGDGAPTVTFAVVGAPGMSQDHFAAVLDVWEQALATFAREMGW